MKIRNVLTVFNIVLIIALLISIIIQNFDIENLKKEHNKIISMNLKSIEINQELNEEIEQLKENIKVKEEYDKKVKENEILNAVSEEINSKILDYIKETEDMKNKLNQ